MLNPLVTRRQLLSGACCVGLGMAVGVAAETPASGTIDVEPYPRDANEALAQFAG